MHNSSATHSYWCVHYPCVCANKGMAVSAQQQCYPFLLVCALSLCVCKQRHGCQCTTAVLPIPIGVCTILVCVQTKAWLPVSGTFNVCTDVDACDCTQVLYGHCKSLYWKLTLGEKSLAAPGTPTRISIVLGFSARCCTSWAIPWPISVPYVMLGLCVCL